MALNFLDADVPEWIQLTPRGPGIEGRDGRKWVLANPEAVVAAFRDHGADLPIDMEHSTQIKASKGEPAPAVGWIKDMEVREGELWARVHWTDEGRMRVSDRQYRYISPAFTFEKASGEILKMVSAGLTNNPNLHLAALNREGAEEEIEMDKAVLEALGLATNASAADAVVAINKLKEDKATALNSAASPDTDKFVPMETHQLALNKVAGFEKVEKDREDEAVNAAVDQAVADGKIAPANKDFYLAACRAEGGLERFAATMKDAPVIAAPSDLDEGGPAKTSKALTDEQVAACRALGMDEDDYATALAEEKSA